MKARIKSYNVLPPFSTIPLSYGSEWKILKHGEKWCKIQIGEKSTILFHEEYDIIN